MRTQTSNGDVFETHCDLIDVTSLHRPDTAWRFTDANGHEHRWHRDGAPATTYYPSGQYDVPSLIWVKDGEAFYEDDDEPHDVGHLECRECGEHITPRNKPDDCVQYIPGLRWFRINGESVSEDEFKRRASEAVTK